MLEKFNLIEDRYVVVHIYVYTDEARYFARTSRIAFKRLVAQEMFCTNISWSRGKNTFISAIRRKI